MSKKIFELFGKPLSDQSQQATALRKAAECPYTSAACDGGGNRHQTTISLGREALALQEFFAGLETVIPGVCSIQSDDETWLVCPRRLFGVKESTQSLLPHELIALHHMDLPQGVELGIWAEVTLNVRDEDSSFNYHFDYLVAPVTRVPIHSVSLLIPGAKFIRELRKQNPSGQMELPDLTQFAIVEVMTASTSGSNTKKERIYQLHSKEQFWEKIMNLQASISDRFGGVWQHSYLPNLPVPDFGVGKHSGYFRINS